MVAARRVSWKWVAVVCLAGAAMGGCTGTDTSHGKRSEHRPDGPAQTAQDSSAHCGVEVRTDSQDLLSLQDVYPATAGTKSLSTRVLLLTTADCGSGQAPSGAIGASCKAAEFPWTSPTSQNSELYASGARVWAEAILSGPQEQILREHVLVPDPKAKEAFIARYRNHFKDCGAQVLSLQNGQPTDFALKGSPYLVVNFSNGRMTVLEGVGPHWKAGELQSLLGPAASRSSKLIAAA